MQLVVQHEAVKILLIDKDDNVLILRKSQDDVRHAGKSGHFNLPGGKIHPRETVADAVCREVLEETALRIIRFDNNPIFKGVWQPTIKGAAYRIAGSFFVCKEWEGKIQLDDEHDDYEWVNMSDIKNYDILPPEDKAISKYFSK